MPDTELPLDELLAIERGLVLLEREDERLARVVGERMDPHAVTYDGGERRHFINGELAEPSGP